MSAPEWDALSWDVQRVYLDGMEADETVPLTFARHQPDGQAGGTPIPALSQAPPEVAGLVDVDAMISDLEATRPTAPGKGVR